MSHSHELWSPILLAWTASLWMLDIEYRCVSCVAARRDLLRGREVGTQQSEETCLCGSFTAAAVLAHMKGFLYSVSG